MTTSARARELADALVTFASSTPLDRNLYVKRIAAAIQQFGNECAARMKERCADAARSHGDAFSTGDKVVDDIVESILSLPPLEE